MSVDGQTTEIATRSCSRCDVEARGLGSSEQHTCGMAEIAHHRGHVLTVTKGEDWFEDQPDWRGTITCLAPGGCGGWWECDEPHEVGGVSAGAGPYGCADDAPWLDQDEFEFHGVLHTWRYGAGWTVPFEGCVVQTADVCDAVYDIGQDHGEGTFVVDDDWGDPGDCTLHYVRPATAEELPEVDHA